MKVLTGLPPLLLLATAAAAQSPLAPAPAATAARPFVDLLAAAKAGDRDAQFALGEAYRTGAGVAADREQAIGWYRIAAGQGDTRASAALGVLLFLKGDRQAAVPLLQAAAERGDARALYVIGTAHFNGDGVPRDRARAYAEMRRSADGGLAQAKRSLAIMEPYLTPLDRSNGDALLAGRPIALPAPRATDPSAVALAPTPPSATVLPAASPQPRVATSTSVATAPAASPTSQVPAAPIPAPTPAPRTSVTFSGTVAVARVDTPPTSVPTRAPASPAPIRSAGWRVQLGAYGSASRAEAQWSVLTRKVSALGALHHAVTASGSVWRLQADGLASRTAAENMCRSIAAAGSDCLTLGP